jgi:4-amino-4-deoxy-L-arabinose transferase-like glycosyltransferase
MSTTGTSWGGSDRELERLAAEPARPLFPLLNHAEAMIPFVVVLAFLPALYAVANRTLSEPGAWLGLAGMKCLAAADPSELFDPTSFDSGQVSSGGPSLNPALEARQPFRFQPPLMTWLTALSMKAFGIGSVAGLVAAAYFCTAMLLVSSYVLARRMGGERLGLIAVLLLAFNPQILQGAQEPVPQSAAVLFALLALAGLMVHWQKSSALVSYPLLMAGISLGFCLMAGGPVALALIVIVAIYVSWWKFEAWQRDRSAIVWDRSQFSRRTALRSTLVLAATAFAVGGWSVLLPGSRHGGDFWNEWLAGPGLAAVAAENEPARSWLFAASWELNRLAVPVFAVALLGLAAIVRDVWRADEDPARRHRGILLVWIVVALIVWLLLGGAKAGDAPIIKVWETLLTIPLIIAAGVGLIEIAERRIGFVLSFSIALVALADAALFGRLGLDDVPRENSLGDYLDAESWFVGVFVPLALAAVGMALVAFTRSSEKRRRTVLTATLVTIVFVNCLWGAFAVRRTNISDRELEDMRAGLSRVTHVDRLTFVALTSPGFSSLNDSSLGMTTHFHPPAQLIYALASLWPQASMNFALSWESAMPRASPDEAPVETGTAVFIAWSRRGRFRGTAPDMILKTAAAPFRFHGLEVIAYVRNRDPPPRVEEDVTTRLEQRQ